MNKLKQNEDLENRHKLNVSNDLIMDSNELGYQEYPTDSPECARETAFWFFRDISFGDDYLEEVVANNTTVLLMPYSGRFKHYIGVDAEWSSSFLDVLEQRTEDDWDYYQLYQLHIGGGTYIFSKFGFDSFIKNDQKTVASFKDSPVMVGYFLDLYMEEFVLPYFPYLKSRIIGSNILAKSNNHKVRLG